MEDLKEMYSPHYIRQHSLFYFLYLVDYIDGLDLVDSGLRLT